VAGDAGLRDRLAAAAIERSKEFSEEHFRRHLLDLVEGIPMRPTTGLPHENRSRRGPRLSQGFDHAREPRANRLPQHRHGPLTVTLGLLPETDHPLRVLELGAFPYFMTALMLKHAPQFQLTLTNERPPQGGRARHAGAHPEPDNGIDYPVEYEEFNIDTDPFPTPMTASTWSSTARSSST